MDKIIEVNKYCQADEYEKALNAYLNRTTNRQKRDIWERIFPFVLPLFYWIKSQRFIGEAIVTLCFAIIGKILNTFFINNIDIASWCSGFGDIVRKIINPVIMVLDGIVVSLFVEQGSLIARVVAIVFIVELYIIVRVFLYALALNPVIYIILIAVTHETQGIFLKKYYAARAEKNRKARKEEENDNSTIIIEKDYRPGDTAVEEREEYERLMRNARGLPGSARHNMRQSAQEHLSKAEILDSVGDPGEAKNHILVLSGLSNYDKIDISVDGFRQNLRSVDDADTLLVVRKYVNETEYYHKEIAKLYKPRPSVVSIKVSDYVKDDKIYISRAYTNEFVIPIVRAEDPRYKLEV